MSASERARPAGAPEEERRAAGAPEGPAQAAGVPPEGDGAEEEGERVEQDLDALLADVTRERDEYLQLAQRARADFENYRKRAAREADEALRRGRSGLARELLPALDNLERGLKAAGVDPDTPRAGEGSEPASEEVSAHEALAQGVALVLHELRQTLARAGVEAYDPVGERFDPAWHEAIATRPEEGTESGTVVETLEKGYRLDGLVLRAARVVVSG